MRGHRLVFASMLLAGSVGLLPGTLARTASATTPVVTLDDDSAQLTADADASSSASSSRTADDENWLTSGKRLPRVTKRATEGSASAGSSEISSVETPGAPPFPIAPIADLASVARVDLANTATGNGPFVPTTDGDASVSYDFHLDDPVPVFFSGFVQASNEDSGDSCSEGRISLSGTVTESVVATVGTGCDFGTHSRQASAARSLTLPAGDYELGLEIDSAMDDTVAPNDPPEAASMKASAVGTFNLSFFPPTAHFRHSLKGFTGHFDGSPSSAGEANRPLAKWLWTFGDGTRATTTTPKVTHRFPVNPAAPPSYRVTLQVVDAGGAVSPPATATVLGTATKVRAHRKARTIHASGSVAPKRPGGHVTVALQRKRHGKFRTVSSTSHRLTGGGAFAVAFTRPAPGSCQVIATYAGDRSHLGSQGRSKPFRC